MVTEEELDYHFDEFGREVDCLGRTREERERVLRFFKWWIILGLLGVVISGVMVFLGY